MSVLRIVVTVAMTLTLAGCGGSDFEYIDDKDVKPGPGLFSGDDGVITLIKSDPEYTDSEKQDETSQELLPETDKE